METYNECMAEYWGRVVPMCKGTTFEGKEYLCVKIDGYIMTSVPHFPHSPTRYYAFAIAIVEDLPVFEGDILYNVLGGAVVVTKDTNRSSLLHCTWNKPKSKLYKTIELTEEEYNHTIYSLRVSACISSNSAGLSNKILDQI